jgi:hypothetical protein
VSPDTVLDIIVKTYSILLRVHNYIQDILSLKNVKLTVKAILVVSVLFLFTYYMSDVAFFWIATNVTILWPLIYNKKKEQVDRVFNVINLAIEENIQKVGFLMNLEKRKKAESKKQL